MNTDNFKSAGQMTLMCYTCVYVRYIKDGSFLLALLAWIIVSLSEFIRSLMTAYLKRNQHGEGSGSDEMEDTDEEVAGVLGAAVIRAVLLKGLRYFQFLILVQTLYSSIYHLNLDVDKDICKHDYGFLIMQVIGELDCGKRGKWVLWSLDLIITLCQLFLITNSLTPKVQKVKLSIPQLQIERYGILSILKFDSWSEDVYRDGPELYVVSRRHAGNPEQYDYGSTATPEEQEIDQEEDDATGLLS